ncbi:OPT super [Malassezia vespertilionis]|uniref:OPT super n=1 Tax=Malassezia vespertilionis TaxID=2020962 RepID=UPI0024B23F5B|nr:OPT super [Malassezia vespertilionis]WFD06002.1 OPT super [Malassezia vespertilionis]
MHGAGAPAKRIPFWRGDDEFSLRALVAGTLVGALITFTNLYLGLQSGWISTMSLQGALMGYAIFKFIPPSMTLFGHKIVLLSSPLTAKENVMIQTIATAIGSLPLVSGAIGILPAFAILDPAQDGVGPLIFSQTALWAWTFGLAFTGIFFASPLREPMILRERLPFPSGAATAQLVSLLHRLPLERPITQSEPGAEPTAATQDAPPLQGTEAADVNDSDAQRNWMALGVSLAVSCLFTVLSIWIPVLYAIPIFDIVAPHGDTLTRWGWWFTPSFSYIGQGIIMGLPTCVSMTAGALVGWAFLGPMAAHFGWAPAEPLDAEYGARGWIIWLALAIMCSEAVVGIATLIAAGSLRDVSLWLDSAEQEHSPQPDHAQEHAPLLAQDAPPQPAAVKDEDEEAHRGTPMNWVLWGLLISTAVGVIAIAGAVGLRIAPWAMCIAFLLASIFSLLAVRALGETDLNPVSGVAKISQLLFGVLQPGNVVANLIAGAIAEAGAMQAGELMQDYKTGFLVGVAPWNQFRGQIIGSLLGVGITVFGYTLYRSTYTIPGPQFPAPTANVWLNLARFINKGSLPAKAPAFMLFFSVFFAITGSVRAIAHARHMHRDRACRAAWAEGKPDPLREKQVPLWERYAMWLPSSIAFATGMMNTPNFSLARLLGGILVFVYNRRHRSAPGSINALLIIVIASGFVLGEGFASVAGLMLASFNVKPLTCFGCRYGCAGNCS